MNFKKKENHISYCKKILSYIKMLMECPFAMICLKPATCLIFYSIQNDKTN